MAFRQVENMRSTHASPCCAAFAALLTLAACGGGGTKPVTGVSGVVTVTVSGPLSSLQLGGGGLTALAAVAQDGSGNLVLSAPITWTSSDESVAMVKAIGVVYALKAGTSRITATSGSASGFKDIAVTAASGTPTSLNVYANNSRQFSPASITIAQNGSVTWLFPVSLAHNVTFTSAAGAPSNIGDTSANGDAQRSFATKGTFTYTCTLHAGMSGTVIVQ